MSDPNFPPQQYPNPSQSQRAQYDQPRQQVYQQPQYAQPQANPYATGQQYAQTPQYSQPQYQQPQYAQYQYGQQPYANPQPADTGSFGWAVLGFFFPIVGLIPSSSGRPRSRSARNRLAWERSSQSSSAWFCGLSCSYSLLRLEVPLSTDLTSYCNNATSLCWSGFSTPGRGLFIKTLF